MEIKFQKNTVKKGDPGFEYDKRVKFNYNAEEAAENSWDESDESDEGVEIVAASQVRSKPKGAGLASRQEEEPDLGGIDDNDYFEDDFDDDFQ